MGWVRVALRSPVDGPRGERPLLAVWIALALAVVVPVLPLVPVVGYLVRALAATARGDQMPPALSDARTLMGRSVGGSLLCLLCLGPPLAALLVTVYGLVSISTTEGSVPTLRFLAGSTTVLLCGLLGLYLLPITLATYGTTGSLRRALSPSLLRSVAGYGAYFVGWTLGALALTLAAGLGSALAAVPRLGPLLAAFALAYGLLVTTSLWGRAIGRARTLA